MVKVLLNQTGMFLFQGSWYAGKVVKVEPGQVSIAVEINGKVAIINCFVPTEKNTNFSTETKPPAKPTPQRGKIKRK